MLIRRPVHAAGLVCIGKEAHRLEERDLVASLDELQSVYHDSRREPWTVSVLPKLRALAAEPDGLARLADIAGMSPRRLRDVLTGRSRPRPAARIALADAVTPALVPNAPLPSERRCAGCGEPIPVSGATTPGPLPRYCSRACKQHAYRTRRPSAPPLGS